MSKKFVVGFMSFFDNELKLEVIEEVNSKLEAAQIYINSHSEWEVPEEIDSLEELQEFMFNGDCVIEVLEF